MHFKVSVFINNFFTDNAVTTQRTFAHQTVQLPFYSRENFNYFNVCEYYFNEIENSYIRM